MPEKVVRVVVRVSEVIVVGSAVEVLVEVVEVLIVDVVVSKKSPKSSLSRFSRFCLKRAHKTAMSL